MLPHSCDFLIIGAGSAGCVLASRLSEDPSVKVVLVEAGGDDGSIWMRVPIGLAKVVTNPRYIWEAATEPDPNLGGNSLHWQSGRCVGGSSSINGMIAARGHPAKYDEWRAAGCPGWGYDDVRPYFNKLEDCAWGDGIGRGKGGPIAVSEVEEDNVTRAFLGACGEWGAPRVKDYNRDLPDGAAPLQLTVREGMRCSASTGYLAGARHRENLTILTDTLCTRVLVEEGRATGAAFERKGARFSILARRGVVLAAGSIRSPQLLEVSGIGDGARLRDLGIPVIRHLPAVGENLQDHLMGRISFEARDALTANDLVRNPLRLAASAAQYAFTRKGMFATPTLTALAYVRSVRELPYPDIRVQLGLSSGLGRLSMSQKDGLDRHSGFHLGAYFLYPKSRGSVHAKTEDVRVQPRILANYLAEARDREVALSCMRIMREIARQPSLARFIVRETRPGAQEIADADLLSYFGRTGHTCWHPVGTCRMGQDEAAVVDPSLRVNGVAGLFVADASVMPFLVASNTNLPVIMIAEKAADLIRRAGPPLAAGLAPAGAAAQPLRPEARDRAATAGDAQV